MSSPFNDPDIEDMFEAIFAFDSDNPGKISMDFVNSVHKFWNDKGFLTENQKQAVINIYDGFNLGD